MRMLVKLKRRILFFITIYFISVFLIYIFFLIAKRIKNPIILAFTSSLFILLVISIILILKRTKEEKFESKGKESTRYTMLCRRCGWEWMSHTTQKIPNKCPNCGEKNRLETIGWRKVKILSKRNKDIRSFFKKS